MIRHIVLFRMNESSSDEERDKLVTELKRLKETTDGIMLECEVALDLARTPTSHDIVLNSLFENMETLEKYRVHHEHTKVLETIRKVCSSTVKIDYKT